MSDEDVRRLEHLSAIPMLSGVDPSALERIAGLLNEVEIPAGTVLMQQGQPGSGLLIVEEGTVAVERPGKPAIEVGPGQFLGELALLTDTGVHTARVRARTPVRVLALSRPDFARLLEEQPTMAVAMLSSVAARLAMILATE